MKKNKVNITKKTPKSPKMNNLLRGDTVSEWKLIVLNPLTEENKKDIIKNLNTTLSDYINRIQ